MMAFIVVGSSFAGRQEDVATVIVLRVFVDFHFVQYSLLCSSVASWTSIEDRLLMGLDLKMLERSGLGQFLINIIAASVDMFTIFPPLFRRCLSACLAAVLSQTQ